ncbi:hypothetical protein [Aequorivita antarctica]|uniref:Uncharacterized protein n=1 Tax=Aequorivita antarctica TaxID=153266 RepID=A0A5C6Z1C2_9FLAO|nr:hypothetical protein [Aequorivita antarctica]TXD73246.1 hypothetical protein ESU54_08905 [Aequorivita antarctica]
MDIVRPHRPNINIGIEKIANEWIIDKDLDSFNIFSILPPDGWNTIVANIKIAPNIIEVPVLLVK